MARCGVQSGVTLVALLCAALLLMLLAPGASWGEEARKIDEDAAGNPYVVGELIVTYEEKVAAPEEEAVVEEAGAVVEEDVPELDAAVVSVPEVKKEKDKGERKAKLADKKEALLDDPSVESVDYNYIRERAATPNDSLFGQQWGLSRVKAPAAWDVTQGNGAVIAIVDGGASASHPDLGGKVIRAYDYYNGDATPNDEDGHGTHVSGIAAAVTNNSRGIAGVAPGAQLFNYDVCGAQYCDDAAIIQAIQAAADNGADVINMSLGGAARSTADENAVNYAWNKGVVVVAAAGNEASSTPSYPGAYTNVIAVSGTDYNNGDSDFSNYGSWVDVAAPGGEDGAPYSQRILSSVPTSVSSSGYDAWNGTSMASPFVAGVAGLLASQNLTGAQIRQRIESTATDLGAAGKDQLFGYGLVNAQAAVAGGGGTPPPPPTTNTAPAITSLSPANGAGVTAKKVTIGVTVKDAQSTLSSSNIALYFDGVRGTGFSYNAGTGRLSYNSPRLSLGAHTVRIVATDPQGLQQTATWSFTRTR